MDPSDLMQGPARAVESGSDKPSNSSRSRGALLLESEVSVNSTTEMARRSVEHDDLGSPKRTLAQRFARNVKDRLSLYKSQCTVQEMSGALGDLGTFIPLVLSMSQNAGANLGSSLFFGGLFNILTGLEFRTPMCVQPMKAIAATAIANSYTQEQIAASGIAVAAFVMFFGITRTIQYIGKYTPRAVICGIQLGMSFTLLETAWKNAHKVGNWTVAWHDNWWWAIAAFLFCFSGFFNHTIPTALVLFIVGLLIAIIQLAVSGSPHGPLAPHFYYPTPVVPKPGDFGSVMLESVLAQIPLTALNSIISVTVLSLDLFPERPAGTVRLSISVGAMNILGCFLGSIPYCHGAGGLAGQYRFGARSEVSIIVLGICKILLGLILGQSLLSLLQFFPQSILSVMLMVCCVELGSASRNVNRGVEGAEEEHRNVIIMLVTAGLAVASKNTGIGFLGGIVVASLFFLIRRKPWNDCWGRVLPRERCASDCNSESNVCVPIGTTVESAPHAETEVSQERTEKKDEI